MFSTCLAIILAALDVSQPKQHETDTVLRTTAEVRALSQKGPHPPTRCLLRGQITAKCQSIKTILQDATGGFCIHHSQSTKITGGNAIAIGDEVECKGTLAISDFSREEIVRANTINILRHDVPPAPTASTCERILSGQESFNLITVKGTITEVTADEIDQLWHYMILQDNGHSIYVSVPDQDPIPSPLESLVDAEVELTGVCLPNYCAQRLYIGPHLELWSQSCIRIVKPAPSDPFESPYLEDIYHVNPTELAKMSRRTIRGTVAAVWHGNRFLLREDGGRLVRIELARGQKLPACGTEVEAAGHPKTDLFHLNLANAFCRSATQSAVRRNATPKDISPEAIFSERDGRHQINPNFYGQLIRMHGIVRSLPSPENANGLMNIDCNGVLVPVDVSANPSVTEKLVLGCQIEATGICIMETESWRSDNLFPVLGGFTLVPRSPDDIRVLSHPPWWTPARLLIVICSLSAALLGIFIWNRVLNGIVNRRGRQLFKEQIARAEETLKVGERTRLAVELHDSLSQNLAGVDFQITATKSAIRHDPETALTHLETAERMLLSSRTELKRCLWDLRGNTLEEKDMNAAISRTVQPVLGSTKLVVRFNVPRAHLSDTTAHSILCIVRELASNAVRHGHATCVRVAGECREGRITFSVRDDGCGFDTEHHLGLDEGHFGLEGIRDRVARLNGTFAVESSSENGTRAKISIAT